MTDRRHELSPTYEGKRCPWCGATWGVGKVGRAHARSNPYLFGLRCPYSTPCPSCKAGPGQWCRRPSDHPASKLHAPRFKVYLSETESNDELLSAWRADRRELEEAK